VNGTAAILSVVAQLVGGACAMLAIRVLYPDRARHAQAQAKERAMTVANTVAFRGTLFTIAD
jgi:glycerol uptake facilitator-like aquaporin